MSQQQNPTSISNLLEEIFARTQRILGSFYTDCIILKTPPDSAEVISPAQYLQPERLLSLLKATSEYQSTQDLRVAASLWNKVYSWTALPSILALMTWAGVGLDASLDNVSFVLEDGEPRALWFHGNSRSVIYPERSPIPIPKDFSGKLVTSVDALHQAVFTGLFQHNLAPVIERIHGLSKLSKKTMWGNAVNASEWLFEELSGYASPEAVQTDYSVLFEQPYSSVMPSRNPLYKLIRTEQLNEPGLPAKFTVRVTCCLYYLIPPDYGKCTNCPLLQTRERIKQMKQEIAESD